MHFCEGKNLSEPSVRDFESHHSGKWQALNFPAIPENLALTFQKNTLKTNRLMIGKDCLRAPSIYPILFSPTALTIYSPTNIPAYTPDYYG